jgi:hypothetical protein
MPGVSSRGAAPGAVLATASILDALHPRHLLEIGTAIATPAHAYPAILKVGNFEIFRIRESAKV